MHFNAFMIELSLNMIIYNILEETCIMKGIIFNEFLEMIEEKFGAQMVEYLIDTTKPKSEASYTSIGTYSHSEIINFVVALSDQTKIPINDLIKSFGQYLFHSFRRKHSEMIERYSNGFDLLKKIDSHIHVEVAKLYSDAQLPHFATKHNGNILEMIYTSERKLSSLAEGLIEETMTHYNHKSTIRKEMMNKDGTQVKFIIEIHE